MSQHTCIYTSIWKDCFIPAYIEHSTIWQLHAADMPGGLRRQVLPPTLGAVAHLLAEANNLMRITKMRIVQPVAAQ